MAVERLHKTNVRTESGWVCAVPGCERTGRARYCSAHANRLRTTGSLGSPTVRRRVPPGTPPVQRIDIIGWVENESGCWEWNGRRDRDGYGLLDDLRGVPVFAHRVAYGKWVGSIPDGKVIMHSCDNPPCINPSHMRIGTQEENLREVSDKGRTKNQKKTHCIRGHEFTPENTYWRTSANGRPGRKCIECGRMHARNRLAQAST